MNELITTNILVIGKSGVGKSSLLNYIFGRKVEKTGVGNSVTKKGIFPHEYEYDESFHINIYDTWGLEPDRADEWEELILDEVHKHDLLKVNEWFSTIIYCIPAKGGPIHDFEIGIINKLINEHNQVLVVITNAYTQNYEAAETKKKTLAEETCVNSSNIILVNSCNTEQVDGTFTGDPFGREALITGIIHNLWMTYKKKTPFIIRKNAVSLMESVKTEMFRYINRTHISIFDRNSDLERIESTLNKYYTKYIDIAISNIKDSFNEAVEYFNTLSKKYIQIDLDFRKSISDDIFRIDFDKEYMSKIDAKFLEIRELHNDIYQLCFKEQVTRELIKELLHKIRILFQTKEHLRSELKRITGNSIVQSTEYLCQEIDSIEEKINTLDFEDIYIVS